MADNIKVTRVTNANVYDGTSNLVGRAAEVKLPEVTAKLSEHKGLGMMGSIELPVGIEKMEMSIKWANPFDGEVLRKHSNIFESRQIQVRSQVDEHGSAGLQAQIPLVAFLTIKPKKTPGHGTFKQHENVDDQESAYSVTAYTLMLDGEEIFAIDTINNTYRVNGVDVLAVTRANLGL